MTTVQRLFSACSACRQQGLIQNRILSNVKNKVYSNDQAVSHYSIKSQASIKCVRKRSSENSGIETAQSNLANISASSVEISSSKLKSNNSINSKDVYIKNVRGDCHIPRRLRGDVIPCLNKVQTQLYHTSATIPNRSGSNIENPTNDSSGSLDVDAIKSNIKNESEPVLENTVKSSSVKSDTESADLSVYTDCGPGSPRETGAVVPGKGPPPDPPVYCCRSGCPTCVWLEYADDLVRYYSAGEGGDKAVQAVKDNVDDPNLRSFILLELQMKGIK